MSKRGLKSVFFFLIAAILIISYASAAENDTDLSSSTSTNSEDKVNKAYQCLRDRIDQQSSLSLEEAIFSGLAIGSQTKISDAITKNKDSSNPCWPKGSCNLKTTAQVLLTLDRIGGNTVDTKNWILSKNKSVKDLIWYLEIDAENNVTSECKITYDNKTYTTKIKSDMTLDRDAGTCLIRGNSNYWLKVKDSCLDKEFKISCDAGFVTTLIYQKSNGGTLFVSQNTNSGASLGSTTEKVTAKCFGLTSTCDYEGTLWAALALKRFDADVSDYLPYLLALSEDNLRFFPSTFLYIFENSQDQYSDIIQRQKQGKYWQESGSSASQRMFDTSLAMLGLSGTSASELESTKDYLLSIQSDLGCWNNNNIRDTAFLLYSGWQKGASSPGPSGPVSCTNAGHFCVASDECLAAGGLLLNGFDCSSFRDSCCNQNVAEQTCSQQNGMICPIGKECSGQVVSSFDGSCCLAACQDIVITDSCTPQDGTCRSSCFSGESEFSNGLCTTSGEICCKEDTITPEPTPSNSPWVWISLLIILIVLLVIAIIYRNKIKMWYYNWKGKVKSSPVKPGPRSPPGASGMQYSPRPIQQRPIIQQRQMPLQQRSPVRRPSPSTNEDKELEETMKKLKEISK